jgi:hypothetical protein
MPHRCLDSSLASHVRFAPIGLKNSVLKPSVIADSIRRRGGVESMMGPRQVDVRLDRVLVNEPPEHLG